MITVIIIVITVIVSWRCFIDPILSKKLAFSPFLVVHKKQFSQIVSHAFVHNNWQHLLFNMFTFYFIGIHVEKSCKILFEQYYILFYLAIYIGGIIFASGYMLLTKRNNPSYSSVGASGGVSAIVFAFILFEPLQKLYLFALPIGIPAFIFGILFLVASMYLAKQNNDSIAHDAHISGAIWGFVLPILLKPDLFIQFIFQIITFTK